MLCFSEQISTKCLSLNRQLCVIRIILIDLSSDEYNQGLHHYQFVVSIDRCNPSCNTFDDPSGRIVAPIKAQNVNC